MKTPLTTKSIISTTNLLCNAFIAGCFISLGCLVNIHAGGGILGSLLFNVGLLSILVLQMPLYTGAIGYVSMNYPSIFCMCLMLVGNMIGAFVCGMIAKVNGIACDEMVLIKLNQPLLLTFVKSLICGALILSAVEGFKKSQNPILVIVPVTVFVFLGAEHCVADMFYLVCTTNALSLNALAFLIVVIVGNTVAPIIINKIKK